MKSPEQIALAEAVRGSRLAEARLAGMKLRARLYPPKAAVGGFPYPARTCAEWEELPNGVIAEREMTPAQRKRDAKQGSEKLKAAILASSGRRAA